MFVQYILVKLNPPKSILIQLGEHIQQVLSISTKPKDHVYELVNVNQLAGKNSIQI